MLTFNLKKQWFDKIKSGEKTHEYREVKPYWDRIIKNEVFDGTIFYEKVKKSLNRKFYADTETNTIIICFMNGMISEEKRPRIYAKLKSLNIVDGKTTDLAIDKPVYDIEFEVIK